MSSLQKTRLAFPKKLTKTDIDVRLSFPMKLFSVFEFPQGNDKVEFVATDDSTHKSWKFGLSRRNNSRHRYPKPVISSGWLAYVRAMGLKMGDKVILYVEKDEATRTKFKIRAQRKAPTPFKLFGKEMEDVELWVDVEKLKPDVAA